jgi:hypothetical protein
MGDENYDVELALGVGIQLLPSALYPKSPEPGDEPDGDTPCGVEPAPRGAAQSGGILGMPVSLPMEHVAEMDELCGKGGTMQTRIAGAILNQIGSVFGLGELGTALSGGPFAEIWSFITEILSPVLCESLNGSVAERLQEIIDRACASASDRAKCEQDMRDEADRNNGQVDLNNTQADVKGVSSEDVMYSKPYWLAQNGNLFMQSWGVVLAKRRFVQEADRLIRFSNRFGGEGKFTELEEEAWVVAGAEMFVDCTDGWEKCQYQAPWTMNWRARLRRFHDPGEYAGAVAEKIIAEGLWSGLERVLEKGPLGNLINRVSGANALGGSVVGRFGGSHIHGFVLSMAREELTERFRSTVYDKGGIRSAAQRAADSLGAGRHEIIH